MSNRVLLGTSLLALSLGALNAATNAAPDGAILGGSNAISPGVVTNEASLSADSTNGLGIVSMDSLDDTRKLDRGDVISFRVVEDREEPKQLVITELGELEVPYAGRYVALNKTCRQLAQELKAYLETELYFKATVIIALDFQNKNRDKDKQSPGKVTVVGEVRVPGVQVIPGDDVLTVSRAILAAGGVGPYANKKKVTITRADSANTNLTRKITVDLTEIWEKGRFNRDEKLEPGDWINVPSTIFRFK